jgi:hypothetical protein
MDKKMDTGFEKTDNSSPTRNNFLTNLVWGPKHMPVPQSPVKNLNTHYGEESNKIDNDELMDDQNHPIG